MKGIWKSKYQIIISPFIYLLIVMFYPIYGLAQSPLDNPDSRTFIMPSIASPTAASLGEYGDIPVSLYGSVTIPGE